MFFLFCLLVVIYKSVKFIKDIGGIDCGRLYAYTYYTERARRGDQKPPNFNKSTQFNFSYIDSSPPSDTIDTPTPH